MSGAGRGTGRISPTDAIALELDSDTSTNDLKVVPSSKFIFEELDGTLANLTATFAEIEVVPIPVGSTRYQVSFTYESGEIGGAVEIYFTTKNGFEEIIAKSPPAVVLERSVYSAQPISYQTKALLAAGEKYRFMITPPYPPAVFDNHDIRIFAKESGVPGTPGTLQMNVMVADNLQPSPNMAILV